MNNWFIVFSLMSQRYALDLSKVEKAVRIVEVSPLPQAPEIVLGIINFHGLIVPVINMRRRFGLPEREIELSDQLIIARTSRRMVGLVVDEVIAAAEYPEQVIAAGENILPGMDHVAGVVKLQDGLILINDLDKFLSIEEEASLEQAMEAV
ncbi:MAG TPA: chemotaxis protein CheW [Methylophilaceae bacterium]|jgi:purine-binding chemotaxis protein CheW